MANDYKQDVGKVPLLAALQPFAPALYALARMMDDMQHKHLLAGSSDPFNQWAQLPEAKVRMAQALERHLLPEDATLWDVNTQDGVHLHATHGLFNLLGALTLHLRELAAGCCHGAAGGFGKCSCYGPCPEPPLHVPAGADWRESRPPRACMEMRDGHACPLPTYHDGAHAWPDMGSGHSIDTKEFLRAADAAGEFRANNQTQWAVPAQWWTGDSGTWRCTCGAGRPEACSCPQVP